MNVSRPKVQTTFPVRPLGAAIQDLRPGFASGHDIPEGVLQVRMNNVTEDGRLDFTKERRVPVLPAKLEALRLNPGDVLFNATNAPGLVGKSAVFNGAAEPVVFSNHFYRLKPAPDVSGDYLGRLLAWHFTRGTFRTMTRQWVNQASINKDQLLALPVPIPPLAEQRRIAAILDKADDLRAKRRAAIATLDTLTESIFLDMFGDPTSNPKGWPRAVLADVVEPTRPITYGILMPGPDVPDGVPYVRVADMDRRGIALRGVRRTSFAIANQYGRSVIRSGDVLMSIRGHVGRLAVVPEVLDGANITQDTARLAPNRVSPRVLSEMLRTPSLQRWMASRTKGAAVRGINLADVRLVPVVVPARALQQSFERTAARQEALAERHRTSLSQLDNLFGSLQVQAFSGSL